MIAIRYDEKTYQSLWRLFLGITMGNEGFTVAIAIEVKTYRSLLWKWDTVKSNLQDVPNEFIAEAMVINF
jgi:hypothetical protein